MITGGALGIYAIVLFFLDLSHINLIGPFFIAAIAAWLIRGPGRLRKAQKASVQRVRSYINDNPRLKKMDNWSRWLGWLVMPLVGAWVYYWIEYFPTSSMEMLAIAFVFFLPSIVLDTIVAAEVYRTARSKLNNHNSP
jgi:hypothetical protein